MTLRFAALALIAAGVSTSAWAFEPVISQPNDQRIIHPPGGQIEVLATREQTDGQLGIIVLDSKAGQGPGPAITHHRGSESWYVIEGQYELHIGDKVVDGVPGTFVSVDAGQPHGFIGKTDGKILIIFQPAGYEHFFMDWDKSQAPIGPEAGKLEEIYGVTRP